MPFGISKKVGGDTPALDKKMEDCVTRLTAKGYSKVSAIKICKVSIQKKAAKAAPAAQSTTPAAVPPKTTVTSNAAASPSAPPPAEFPQPAVSKRPVPPQLLAHRFKKKKKGS